MIHIRPARVLDVLSLRSGVRELLVDVDGVAERALSYDELIGPVEIQDDVVLNTTAADLNLGTGGHRFVMSKSAPASRQDDSPGHIMKLRYTPCQIKVLSVEEQGSPYRSRIEGFENLAGLPVVTIPLHSMLAPVAAVGKWALGEETKLAYVMTDGGALPVALSKSVADLRSRGLVDAVITVGHAFGGDLEAVNMYTGLIAAKEVVGAQIIVAGIGPGKVGTATRYGFSEIEQGQIINAAGVLGGMPIAVPRINFADSGYRHYGISPHTLTILAEVAIRPALVPLPVLAEDKMALLRRTLRDAAVYEKHHVREIAADATGEALRHFELKAETMGRAYEQEPDFFLAAGAGGMAATDVLRPISSPFPERKGP